MVDALCLDDLDLYAREIDSPLDELWQDLYHRIFEVPGSNIDDPDRGVGIEDLLSGAYDPKGSPSDKIAKRIESDFRKDKRVQDVSATIVQTSTTPVTFKGAIRIVCDEGELGITLESDGAGGVRAVRLATGGA